MNSIVDRNDYAARLADAFCKRTPCADALPMKRARATLLDALDVVFGRQRREALRLFGDGEVT
jgi:hypothetical protein